MEWMLQVVDDIDDMAHALRFRVANFGGEIGLAGCLIVAAAAIAAATAWGADALVLAAALGTLGAAALLKLQARLPQPEAQA